jgi:subtilase family serine protease
MNSNFGPTRRLIAGTFAAVLIATTGGALAASAETTHQVPVLLPGLRLARSLGSAPRNERRTIGVAISSPDPAGEQALYNALYDPASPQYRQFLTPDEYAARFGVSTATVARVTQWLRSGGLTIETTPQSGAYLTATGSIGQLERLFATTIGRYRIGSVAFEANDRAPSVPASLPIAAVVGLDTLHRFYLPQTTQHPSSKKSVGAASGFSGVLQPRDLWGLYDQPSTDLGQGQTIGIFGVGESDSTITNLRLFEQHEHFPKVPVRVVRTEPGGDATYGDNSGSIEWYLDTQASTGMAPDVSRLDLYFSHTLFDADIFASFKKWVDDPAGPRQMNASFGECEQNPTNPVTGPLAQVPYGTELGDQLEPVAEPILRQATLEGRTLFSSTGDTGSGCPEVVVPVLGAGNGVAIQPVPMVNFPAASPYAVGVGGTVITTDPNKHTVRQSETAWTFTGGGSSFFIQEPAYQKPVANVKMPCLSQPDGTPYSGMVTCRGIPDVATLSGNVLGNG